MRRRSFLGTSFAALAGATLMPPSLLRARTVTRTGASKQAGDVLAQRYPFTLPPLGCAPSAVEPAVDARTMQLHHDEHHAAYVRSLNEALAQQPTLHDKTLRELLTGLSALPEAVRTAVRNHGGGHANHALFWMLLAPGGVRAPTGALASAITRDFKAHASMISALKESGMAQFGSGWTWLVRDGDGKLTIRSTANQDTPLSDKLTPVVGIDVWEHAYYLKYQNRRAEYLDAVLGAINWDVAGAAFDRSPA